MATFDRFYKREKIINRTLEIDEDLYEKLAYLSKNVYDASINRLVNASIEELLKTEDIKIYESKRNSYVARSFLIRESLLEGLYKLKKKYRISIYLLVNIAIKNSVQDL